MKYFGCILTEFVDGHEKVSWNIPDSDIHDIVHMFITLMGICIPPYKVTLASVSESYRCSVKSLGTLIALDDPEYLLMFRTIG